MFVFTSRTLREASQINIMQYILSIYYTTCHIVLTLRNTIEHIPSNPNLLLELILRPCLYKNIICVHPDNDVRVATTYDLILAGYSHSSILSIYSTLGWEDFEDEYCLAQIKHSEKDIKEKKYERYSCTKLRELKIPEVCCVG